jgi:outer membrane protein OmpA-like peptidoglycan-associated protein
VTWQEKVTEAKRAEGNKQWGNAARLYNDALDIIDDPIKTPQSPSSAEIQSLYSLASRANMLAKNSVQLTRSVVVPDLVPDCSTRMRTVVRGVEITKHLIAVEFELDKTVFTTKGEGAAYELAHCLKEKPVSRITLVGHTDETGTEAYNYQLSLDRANALQKYLKQQDIRINIRTEGKGEKEPLPDKPSGLSQEERYQLDRRVEVITGS